MSRVAALQSAPRPRARDWRGWRDRLLSAPRFQERLARLPVLRRLARSPARCLFDLCAGFVHSQVLYASVELGVLQALRAGPLSRTELQQRCALTPASARVLLEATDDLGLTETRRGGCHGLGLLGAALFGNAAVLRMIEHQPLFYADLAQPIALLRRTRADGALATHWGYAGHASRHTLSELQVDSYTSLMSQTQPLVAEDLLHAYDFARHRCVLDVGGGDGTFLCRLASHVPALQLMLFDLPAVAQLARARLSTAGLAQRCQIHGGDFLSEPLPAGADAISLVRVLHDHDDPAALLLLQAAHAALQPGGRLIIAEPMRALPGSVPSAAIYLSFYLLAMGQGRVRSVTELALLLQSAGFTDVQRHATAHPWQCGVLSAQPRAAAV